MSGSTRPSKRPLSLKLDGSTNETSPAKKARSTSPPPGTGPPQSQHQQPIITSSNTTTQPTSSSVTSIGYRHHTRSTAGGARLKAKKGKVDSPLASRKSSEPEVKKQLRSCSRSRPRAQSGSDADASEFGNKKAAIELDQEEMGESKEEVGTCSSRDHLRMGI
jgi:hypothetical protein